MSATKRLSRRIAFVLLVAVGLALLTVGTAQGGWVRIHHFSTQICLSCMGLV